MSRYLYMYVKPLNKGFIIPLISFSSLLVSNFLKRCMVSSEYPTLHVWCTWKKKTRENKRLKFSWWPEKNHCGLKSSLLKKTCLIIGKKIKDHTHHFCPYSCPVLQYIIKTYLACSIVLTRQNDIIVKKNLKYLMKMKWISFIDLSFAFSK